MSFNYSPKIVTSGLVLCLDAANNRSYVSGSTSWTDLSPSQKTGILTNGPTFNTGSGGNITFDGVDDFIDLTFANPQAETVIVWAKSAVSAWNQHGWISSARRPNGHIIHPEPSYVYGPNSRQVTFYLLDQSSTYYNIGNTTPSNITIPHMYIISTNGSNSHKCYIDGTLISTSTTAITRTSSPTLQTWYLGRDDTAGRYGNGNIYCAYRYNRQLSDTEILQNYNAQKSRFGI
jgi:hypothetical protein